jgi:FHA domain
MAATPFEHADQASRVLRAIVAEHGPELLSRPRELGNLLADLLPDAPRIARLLVTAAQDQVARELSEHTSAGMDVATASAMVASSFAGATLLAPDACSWVVREFALALGLVADPDWLTIHAGGATRAAGQGSVGQSTAPMPHAAPGISHLHAVLIAQQDGTWLLLDQGSSNGTQVNGRQVASGVPVPLRDGDRISLGVWTVLTVRAA